MIRKASELIDLGETAFVVFTSGLHLRIEQTGSGQSGNWIAGAESLRDVDNLIIYRRDEKTAVNTV